MNACLGPRFCVPRQQGEPRVDIKLGGQIIFIAPIKGDNTAPPPSMPYRGLEHIGLAVTGLDQVVAELKAKGAEFTMEPTAIRPGIRICFRARAGACRD
jgi:lactoylglutathione lyase